VALGDHDAVAIDDSATIERSWTVWAVREAIEQLPRHERVVARLAHVEGLTHREISDRLGIPIGTVKSRGARAQARLATALVSLVSPAP
jgi:RNA polymerase sigma-70 factor (ECF subfamily)